MGAARQQSPPRAGKRERNKAENRAAILDAARRVFADLGYEAATIRDIIGTTDLAAGTFYNYFPDKESVLRALLDEKMDELQRRADEARRDAETIEDVVRRTLEVSFSVVAEDRQVFDLLRRNSGAIRAILDEPGFVANRDRLRRDIERVMRPRGGPAIDAEYLTAAISGLAFEVAACAVDRQPARLEAAAGFATSLVLGGIAALGTSGRTPAVKTPVSLHPRSVSGAPRAARKTAAAVAATTTRTRGKETP